MLNPSEVEELHEHARTVASGLKSPDKKQLRFNDIVECATVFYQPNPMGGVRELVESCDRECTPLYIKGQPMWKTLRDDYAWLIADAQRPAHRLT